jgi:hypothetical protein
LEARDPILWNAGEFSILFLEYESLGPFRREFRTHRRDPSFPRGSLAFEFLEPAIAKGDVGNLIF